MNAGSQITERNGWIDVLRALSAVAVALFHFNSVPAPVPAEWAAQMWHATWQQGHWGVIVFFVVSGYCIFPGWNRAQGCLDFLWRRVGRIFPPYWLSLLLVVALAAAARLLTGVNDVAALPRAPRAIAATILLLTNPFTALPTINWVYWTLTALLACYTVMGLVLTLPRAGRLGCLAGLHGLLCFMAAFYPPAVPGPIFFVVHWPVFGAGVALAVFLERRRAGWVMLLVSASHATWQFSHDPGPHGALLVCAGTLVILASGRNYILPAVFRPLAWIGKISYSLYLVHVPLGVYVAMRFLAPGAAHSLSYIGTQLLWLVVSVGAASLFYLGAERPFLPPRPAATA